MAYLNGGDFNMKKNDIRGKIFTSTQWVDKNLLNDEKVFNNVRVTETIKEMFREFKDSFNKEYNLGKINSKEGLVIINKIYFIPESEYFKKEGIN